MVQELFNCIVGTSKETLFTNAIYTLLQKNNASSQPLPGQPQPAVCCKTTHVCYLQEAISFYAVIHARGASSLKSSLQCHTEAAQDGQAYASLQGASFVDLLRIKLQVAKEKKGKGKSSLQSTKQESSKRPKKNQSANPDQDDDESAAIADDAVS